MPALTIGVGLTRPRPILGVVIIALVPPNALLLNGTPMALGGSVLTLGK